MKIDEFPGLLRMVTVRTPYYSKTGRLCQHAITRIELTQEQEDWLRRWFPLVENGRLMKASGLTHSTLHRYARLMRLQKDPQALHGIKRRATHRAMRTCERNGYYNSLRGRRPSEACLQGARQRWQQIKAGQLLSPLAEIKKHNPRRFKRIMAKRGEHRKRLMAAETRRVVYGLPRKTRLHMIVGCRYTKSQVCHRYNAAKRGYLISADCSDEGGDRYRIFYDESTPRSPRFERNLEADGFELLPWSEE